MSAKKPPVKQSVESLIAEIRASLEVIKSNLAWLIKADQRFVIGQRVVFSNKARQQFIARGKRAKLKGTVRGVDLFSIEVQLDGVKRKRSYHHSFFNPVSGPKLF